MYGPNGTPKESVFPRMGPDRQIVIEHVAEPTYRLIVTLTDRDLALVQEFESPELAPRMRPLCEPANEQNLDRLQSLLAAL